ncbi:hypothetical protein BH10ACT3_BH10ACT3_04410 [soil metagenome]
MNAPARLVAFAGVVVIGLGGGYAVGAAVGPIDDAPAVTVVEHGSTAHGSTSTAPSEITTSTGPIVSTTAPAPATGTGSHEEHGS